MNQIPELERRRVATQATLAKFRGKAFDWNGCSCIHLAKFQIKAMGRKSPKVPAFKSAIGAKKALQARGKDSVIELLDGLLERIPPASMLLGDLAAVPGDEGLDAVFVNAGPRKLFGWREDAPKLVVLDVSLDEITAAWRL